MLTIAHAQQVLGTNQPWGGRQSVQLLPWRSSCVLCLCDIGRWKLDRPRLSRRLDWPYSWSVLVWVQVTLTDDERYQLVKHLMTSQHPRDDVKSRDACVL